MVESSNSIHGDERGQLTEDGVVGEVGDEIAHGHSRMDL